MAVPLRERDRGRSGVGRADADALRDGRALAASGHATLPRRRPLERRRGGPSRDRARARSGGRPPVCLGAHREALDGRWTMPPGRAPARAHGRTADARRTFAETGR